MQEVTTSVQDNLTFSENVAYDTAISTLRMPSQDKVTCSENIASCSVKGTEEDHTKSTTTARTVVYDEVTLRWTWVFKCLCTNFHHSHPFHHAQQYSTYMCMIGVWFYCSCTSITFKLCEKLSYLSFIELFLTIKFQVLILHIKEFCPHIV